MIYYNYLSNENPVVTIQMQCLYCLCFFRQCLLISGWLWNEHGKIEIIVMDSVWAKKTHKSNKWNRYSQQKRAHRKTIPFLCFSKRLSLDFKCTTNKRKRKSELNNRNINIESISIYWIQTIRKCQAVVKAKGEDFLQWWRRWLDRL